MLEAQRAQYGPGSGPGFSRGGRGGRDYGGGYGMRGGRPGPYDRMGGGGGPPLGRGYGAHGPGMRGGRNMKSFGGNDGGYGGGYGGGRGGFGDYGDNGGGYGMGFGGGNGGMRGGGMGMSSQSSFGGGGGGGPMGGMRNAPVHIVHMRGLPFRVTENDIAEWFSSVVDPMDISIIYNNQGRPTGEADVMFAT